MTDKVNRGETLKEFSEADSLLDKAKRVYKNQGPSKVIKYFFEYLYHNLELRHNIVYRDKKYKVYRNWKNKMSPWRGEREAELPVFEDIIKSYQGKKILEVGNVMNNYYPSFGQTVVDKYEIAPGVINEDAVTFKGQNKYDLIISISTLEHIGWEESNGKLENVMKAIKNLRSQLTDDGVLIFSFDWTANYYLRNQITNDKLKFDYCSFLVKQKVGSDYYYSEETYGYVLSKIVEEPNEYTFIGVMKR